MNNVMGNNNVVNYPSELDRATSRIKIALGKLEKDNADWIEDSIELAVALKEASDALPSNVAFGAWFKEQGFTLNSNDRTALIKMAGEIEVMRKVLRKTKSRSYQLIWNDNESRFTSASKTVTRGRPPRPRRKPEEPVFAKTRRKLKLEEEMPKITNTSLDTEKEMDALIELKVHRPDDAKQLVERAAKGEAVSARAVIDNRRNAPPPELNDLTELWRLHSHNLLRAWVRAPVAVRKQFVAYLEEKVNDN